MDILCPIDSERAVVGIAISSNAEKKTLLDLSPDDFSDVNLAAIFKACRELIAQRQECNYAAVDVRLTRAHGAERAAQLIATAMEAATEYRLQGWKLPEAVRIVREASGRRKLIRIGEAISRGAGDEKRDLAELIECARNHLRQSAQSAHDGITLSDAMINAHEALQSVEKPFPTGIAQLDKTLSGGLHRGELTILGARPAVGKSAVLLEMAIAAAQAGANVVFFSLEMSGVQIGARAIAAASGLNVGLLRAGEQDTAALWADLAESMCVYGDAPERIRIFARGGVSVEDVSAEVSALHDQGACDLLIIDYLQLLQTRQKVSNDFERLGIVSRGLKAITLDLNIPVVAAAQVRRQNNGGILRAPNLDELRGSGDIEQDADAVVLMHRPEAAEDSTLTSYGYQMQHTGLWETLQGSGRVLISFDVAKNRQGATGRAWSVFTPSRMRFCDPEEVNGDVS